MAVNVVGSPVYRIDDPYRTREIEATSNCDFFAEEAVLRKSGLEVIPDQLVGSQVLARDKLGTLLFASLVRPLTRPLGDDIAGSSDGGNRLIQNRAQL